MEESLYYAELKFLMRYCQTCLDKKMKEKMMMFLFKKTLFDNAVELGFEEDAKQYYIEMLNMLDVRRCNCKLTCNTCSNGSCSIC